MSEWTARKLDDLPDGTVITWTEDGEESYPPVGIRTKDGWEVSYYGDDVLSGGILREADPGSIRVVSVPIDALLDDEAVRVAAIASLNRLGVTPEDVSIDAEAQGLGDVLRAAIAHVTGEAL